jgi:hypothetical protein
MEFVSNIEDIMKVVGTVKPLGSHKGIYMALPEQILSFDIHNRIVYGETQSGKKYIETVSVKDGAQPVYFYGEASLPEILAFARKAMQDLPDSEWTKELHELSLKLEAALK